MLDLWMKCLAQERNISGLAKHSLDLDPGSWAIDCVHIKLCCSILLSILEIQSKAHHSSSHQRWSLYTYKIHPSIYLFIYLYIYKYDIYLLDSHTDSSSSSNAHSKTRKRKNININSTTTTTLAHHKQAYQYHIEAQNCANSSIHTTNSHWTSNFQRE